MRPRGRAVRRILWASAAGLIALGLIAFVPTALRRDAIVYRWAGAFGEEDLAEPIGIAYRDGRLYVTDAARSRLVVYDTTGRRLDEWAGDSLGLGRPMHLSVGSDGLLYVADYLEDRVAVVDPGGTLVRYEGGESGSAPGALDAPGGAAPIGRELFVADFYNHRIGRFGAGSPAALGRPGRVLPGRLHYPTDVATDSLVYVADAYNHRIQVFRTDGEHVRSWGGPLGTGIPGPWRGWFRVATGVEAAAGRVYVADFHNHRVQVFTAGGRYVGGIADSLELPTDAAVAEDGTVYVADFGHGRIARFAPWR